jgi:Tfp pilus assembly protein PilF
MKLILAMICIVVCTSVNGTPTQGTASRSRRDSLLTAFVKEDNQRGYKALLENDLSFSISDTIDPVFRGLYLMSSGRNDEARKSFSMALKDEPGDPVVRGKLYYLRSQCQMGLGDLNASLQDIDSAIALTPAWPEAWSDRSALLTTMGRFEEGLVSSETALSMNGKSCKAWNNRGFALSRLKREQEATDCFDSALAYCADFDEALFNRGLAFMAQNDYRKADEYFSRCLAANAAFCPALLYKS